MIIRPAVPTDASDLTQIALAAYAPYVALIGREPAPMRPDFPALIAAGAVWIAPGPARDTSSGPAAGAVGYVIAWPDGDHWHLENIAVAPHAHGRGIGRALIAWVEAMARTAGARGVTLYTNAMMTDNLALYPRLGYRQTDRRIDEGFDRVFFVKPL